MEFEYEFDTSCDGRVLSMYIKPNKLIIGDTRLIFEWLIADVMTNFDEVRSQIDDVLSGKIESYDASSATANSAVFNKDTSTITCNFEELNYEPCTLPTQMLREILDIWEAEYNKFYGKNKEIEMPKKKKGIFGIFNN